MQYLITLLEGILSFISPCMLPLLPLYISYFMGSDAHSNKGRTVINAISFVTGFSLVFALLGLFAGSVSTLLKEYQTIVNLIGGLIIILFGLSYLEIIPISFGKRNAQSIQVQGILSSFVFGIIYSVSLTPCVGAFLGAALAMASASGTAIKGLLLLVTYSMGMGIPFVLSAVLIDRMKNILSVIKNHYSIIVKASGAFLIVTGILLASGMLIKLSTLLNF